MDDCCIFAINNAMINDLIASLGEEFVLQDEGSIKNYLGIHMTQQTHPDCMIETIILTQLGLITSNLNNQGIAERAHHPKKEICQSWWCFTHTQIMLMHTLPLHQTTNFKPTICGTKIAWQQ